MVIFGGLMVRTRTLIILIWRATIHHWGKNLGALDPKIHCICIIHKIYKIHDKYDIVISKTFW